MVQGRIGSCDVICICRPRIYCCTILLYSKVSLIEVTSITNRQMMASQLAYQEVVQMCPTSLPIWYVGDIYSIISDYQSIAIISDLQILGILVVK